VPALYRHPGVAVREGNLKYVATEAGDEALHDLDRDPAEAHDLAATRPQDLDRLRNHGRAWQARRAGTPGAGAKVSTPDEEIEDHLRMLGYIE
jgi:arylsulfatase A-like enzyme